ncbi:translocation/assembly module TamB domain-containing protein [Thermus aquaticus]|nr:translocation/assembly module TamB domain-containing protein [Thermus aquaticus]
MRRGLLLLFLGLFLLLPAWPPLLKGAVDRALPLLGFRGSVGEVSGHLLFGLRLKRVALQGEGIWLQAEEVDLFYDLLGLLRRELPLALTLRKARLGLTWEALIPEKPGPPPAVRVVFRSLRLEEVEAELPRGGRLFLPSMRLSLVGENPYRFLARLPGGSFQGEAKALSPDLSAWEVAYAGEVRGLAFFYEGLKGGRLFGVFRVGPSGMEGRARVEGGAVELVGFPLTGVEGEVLLRDERVEAVLKGVGLEGPLRAKALVDLRGERYRFRMEGQPRLPALARHYGLTLPLEGEGRLVLEGEGWEAVRVRGRFVGEGRLLGEPFRHRGTLAFDRVFTLEAEAEGRLFDRDYALSFALRGGRYGGSLADTLGSRLALEGEGSRLRVRGRAAWPRPLEGLAAVDFRQEGKRWRLGLQSPGVRLPLFAPLDLSGEVRGEGEKVAGRLGPLGLSGTWGSLALTLAPTPMVVGSLEGEGRLLGGRLSAELRYDAPYARFPLSVRQEAWGFRFQSPYGEGSYRGGALALTLRGLPIRALDEMRLYGKALYREGGLSGRLFLKGRYLELEAGLRRLGADLAGRLLTPLGEVPLKGRYDPGPGLLLEGLGLRLTYGEALRLQGQGELGGVGLRADLAYREGFSGFLDFATPYGVSGRVLGEGKRLALKVFGLLEGEGEVYPEVRLLGRLLPPLPEGLSLPPLTFRLTREGAEVLGVGRVAFAEGFPFRLDLPFRYRGAEGRLLAQGGLEGGRFTLSTPYGEVKGEGPWRRLGLVGGGEVPALGAWSLKGSMDLPTLAYRGEVGLPKGGLRLALSGKGAGLRFLGQAPGLRVLGGYEGGLSLLLQAEGYDLTPFGLPARAFGTWGHRGGRMRLAASFGEALFQGEELLSARIRLSGPYLEGEGRVSPEGATLTFRGAYRAGGLEVRARGEGGGPWGDLRFQVLGEARVPHLDPMAFGGEVRTAGGIRYRLLGPVSLEGEGVRYRGHLDLPLTLLGKAGRLSGSFQGEGLKVAGEGEGSWAGLAFSWRGAYGDGPSLSLRLPGGEARLEGREVVLALEEVAPLAEALGVSLTGKAWARLALSGEGEGEAALRLGQEALAATYRGTLLSLVLPERGLGLSWDWREGKLMGLGALEGEGAFRLGEEASGAFRYRGVEVGFAGPLSALKVQARYREEALGEAWLRGVVDLLALKGEGEMGYASAYAEGEGRFAFSGSRYEGEGRLRSLRYLVQEGPFRFSGEGLEAEALWEAPMAFSARYEDGLSLWARGRAEVEGFQVEADLAHGPEGYRGSLKAVGWGLEVRALGEGPLRFQVLGEGLKAEGEASGLEVFGTLGFSRAWGKARLEAGGRFSGRLPELSLEGEGALVGEGKRLPFAFRYRGAGLDPKALSLFGEGEGYRLALAEGRLSLELDQDLTPFGLPARLRASADGPFADPVAVVLERPEGRLSGKVWPWPLRAELKGEVLGEGVEARYEGSLALRFLGPHLRGEARYGEGLLGALTFRYPLLEGEVDLGEGRFTLRGEGGLGGRVEGAFCLPPPLGKCPGLRADLEGGLTYGASAFSGRYAYRAQEGFLGELTGEGRLATPYGAVRLLGRGAGLDLEGEGLPLKGRLELFPLALTYRYEGPLPQGLGALWAQGTYPGPWLLGTYRYGDLALELKGLPGFRVALAGEGVSGEVGLEGVRLVLEGFRLGPLALSGRAEGPFSGAHVDLSLSAFGREARAVGRVGTEGLALAFSGDLEGQVSWKEAWAGRLAFREGWLDFAGKGFPEVRGEVLGVGVALLWPRLEVSGLEVDLLAREARGETALFGLTARGEGKEVALGYRVPGLDLPLEGRLDLSALALELTSPKGEGALRYGEGRVSGRLALDLGGLLLDLEGTGDRVRLVGRHPDSPWWAAGAGSLEGEVDLQGAYRLDYRAGPQALTLTGRLLEARLVAEGPYLSGSLTYPAGGELKVDLPLAPLESRFGGRVHGEGYQVEGVLAGGVGRMGVKGRLLPLEGELTLEETALEDFLARYAPYLKGRVSGRLSLAAREAQGEVAGFVEVSGKRLPLSLKVSLAPGRAEGEGRIGESPFRLSLEGDRVDFSASPRAFPLHLLLAAVAGPLEGEAYWTGAARLRFPLSDPRRGEGVLVGESLVFRGGGDELRGRAAFRYGGETLYVDHLRLSGKGLWEGGGYWSPRGSDLYLNLKDTAFTPVLQVIPALKPYRPEASGTLALRLTQEGFQVQMEAFRFRLGPVAGYLPTGLLALNGGARAEGEITLTAPFPGRGRLGLEGTLDSFQVSAKGAVSLPGLKEDTPAEVSFRYPTYGVALRLGEAEAEGTLFPLRLAGYGRLPLSYPQYYLQDGLLDVKSFFLYEEKGTYHLTGNAEVLRARLAIPEASARNLSGEGVKVAEKPAPVPLVFEGVRLFAERGVLVQERLAQGELKGEVYLGGTYQDPFLAGEVQALWGSFRLWDSLFTLDPGSSRLQFSPDRGFLPRFTLKAKAETRGYQVFLSAEGEFVRENGRVKVRLTPRFTSEPPLSEPEIYALLALGTPDVARLTETLPQAALGAALENLVLGQLERELAKAFGLDRFQVEVPLFQGGELGETRFSIGKYLSPELFLGYQVDLRGQQTFSAQYRRDGLTFTLGTTFQFGDGRLSRLDFALGYDLTSSLAVSLGLEASDTVRFSVGALYRW